MLSLTAVLLALGCNKNAFLESAKKDSDAALLFEARKQMNNSDWSGAITSIGLMTAVGRATRESKTALASAYAGRCGLNFVDFADRISNAGTTNYFPLFLSFYKAGGSVAITDCTAAEAQMLSISTTAADRTADENVFLAFAEFAKIGVILAHYADSNDDGTADAGFDPCDTNDLPTAVLREIGTGITIAVASLSATGGSVGASLASSVSSACSVLAGVNPALNFCSITDPSAFTANQLKAIGGIVRTTDNPGLGTCAGDLATCVCP